MKKLLATICMQASLVSFCQTTADKDWVNYNTQKFTITYPPNWLADTSGISGTRVIIFSPLEDSADKFRENINVLVQNLEGLNINLEKYTEISEGQVKEMLTDSRIYVSENVTNKAATFHKIIYSAVTGSFHLKFEQYYFVKNSKALVVTFTSESNKFEQFQTVAEEILGSFKLK